MSVPRLGALLILFAAFVWCGIAVDRANRIEFAVPLQSPVRALSLCARSDLLGIVELSGQVSLWDLASKTQQHVIDRTAHGVDSIAFSPNGEQLVVASDEDAEYKYGGGATSMSFYANKKAKNIKALVISVQTGKEVATLTSGQSLTCVGFDPSGQWLVAASLNRVEVWDTKSWKHVATHNGFFSSGRRCLAFPPSGAFVAIAGWEGDVLFLKLPDLKVQANINVASAPISPITGI
jgi:WD40 repeat protein